MFVTSLKWKFDAESIRGTPRTQGVFGLWDEGSIVYIGPTARSVFSPAALGGELRLPCLGPAPAMNAKGLLQNKYVRMLKDALTAWWNDQAPSKGAALAYY